MHLPLEIYGTFFLEKRFGFNKTTLGTFIVDKIKGLLLLGEKPTAKSCWGS